MGLKLIVVLCAILCYWGVISFHSIYSENIHVDGGVVGLWSLFVANIFSGNNSDQFSIEKRLSCGLFSLKLWYSQSDHIVHLT